MNLIPEFVRATTKNEAIERRMNNINFIRELPTQGLEFETNERQLLFYQSDKNEFVSIQYPGKEANVNLHHVRPWDFRPKLLLDSGTYLHDLSFKNIWDCLFDLFNATIHTDDNDNNKKHLLKLLACEFYRIAFMIDYEFLPVDTTFQVTNIQTGDIEKFTSTTGIYIYTPNDKIINKLKNHYPTILGASWESFFMYNDLLALNEDCKYFYNQLISTGKESSAEKYIRRGAGRVNTMLTHIAIIAFILGEYKLTDLLQNFVNHKGIGPLTMEACNKLLSEYMY